MSNILGQSPSHVIFDRKINETRHSRHELYDLQSVKDLREELVSIINQDVYEHSED